MSNCKNPELQATSSCHLCNLYKQATFDLVSEHLTCQPRIRKQAAHLLDQRRAHQQAILRLDTNLQQITDENTLPRFSRFSQFYRFPLSEEK